MIAESRSTETKSVIRTFLFSDIVGSTEMWERDAAAMCGDLKTHFQIIEHAIEQAGGRVFKTVGDAVCAEFALPNAAVEAAVHAQLAIGSQAWQHPDGLAVRIGIATGEATEIRGYFFGQVLNLTARVEAASGPRQVLVSASTHESLEQGSPARWDLHDVGMHRLKGIAADQRLYAVIHPQLDSIVYPPKTRLEAPHNLPPRLSRIIGRTKEVNRIVEMMSSEDARLITLLGPGGIGKTRLATEVGWKLLTSFPEGVYFLDLSSITTGDQIEEHLFATLQGVPLESESRREALRRIGAGRRFALVLDNFEHVIDHAPIVADVLETTECSVLTTSREALEVGGECIIELDPLATDHVVSDAMQLFAEGGRAPCSMRLIGLSLRCPPKSKTPLPYSRCFPRPLMPRQRLE